jgi:hypothetical protein
MIPVLLCEGKICTIVWIAALLKRVWHTTDEKKNILRKTNEGIINE